MYHSPNTSSGGTQRSSGVDPFLSTLLFISLFVLIWPALIVGAIIWRFVHGRAAWLWLAVVIAGAIGASLLWKLDDPMRQLLMIFNVIDVRHPTQALYLTLPFWLSTLALSPLAAGGIELLRPRNAKERLLSQVAKAEARRIQLSKRASRCVKKAPDTTSDGIGVLGRVIE